MLKPAIPSQNLMSTPSGKERKRRPVRSIEGDLLNLGVVLIDDHPLLRKGLARIINAGNQFNVCGEAGHAEEGLEVIRATKPGLVVVDIGLPKTDGIELTKMLRSEFPELRVLILSMHEEPFYAARALRAGADGYIVKQEAIEKIGDALREVSQGRRYVTATIATQLITHTDGSSESNATDRTKGLTEREREVLELIGAGEGVQEVAQKLRLSPKTVETHRAHIKEKLNLQSAREVARFAAQWIAERSV